MGGLKYLQVFLAYIVLLVSSQNNRTISDVYVNLPATCAECRKVKYELVAYGGCYSWTSFNPQTVSLEQIPDSQDCYNRAIISAVVSTHFKTVVIMKAVDVNTKDSLISQVKVSRIAEIKILTNFKAIDVEDVQKLFIQAFDESNNVISSVEGLKFEWKIEARSHALKIISSKEANYENTPARLEMEGKRFQTDLILVRGMETGQVEVSAKLCEKDYGDVKEARILLYVIEPFFLIPDKPVYLLTNSIFDYKIGKGRRQNKGISGFDSDVRIVSLPSKQYHFSPMNPHLLSTEDSGRVATKDVVGEVVVRVEDANLKNNAVEGLIIIVEPDIVEISIKDITGFAQSHHSIEALLKLGEIQEGGLEAGDGINNWNLVVGHTYALTSYLTNSMKNIITMTQNVGFLLTLSREHFQIVGENSQKSIVIIKAISPSYNITKIKSTLSLQSKSSSKAFAERDARIASQVKIQSPPDLILLPYLARTKIKTEKRELDAQMWKLEATGGFGSYRWESANAAVATLTSQGTVYGLQLGVTRGYVFDALNKLNNDSIEIEVARVGKLDWLEEKLELSISSVEILSAIALDAKGRKFTNCTSIPLEWSIKDETILKMKEDYNNFPYSSIQKYVNGDKKEIIKLKHYYETVEDTSEKTDERIQRLIDKAFNSKLQLHNLFGICGQKEVSVLREGLARIMYSFQIAEEDGANYRRDSAFAFILAYKELKTLSPSYDLFLKNLKKDERDESYKRYIQQLKSENEFVLGYGSGLFWEVEGGSSRWVDLPNHYFEEITTESSSKSGEVSLDVRPVNGGDIKNAKPHHYLQVELNSPAEVKTGSKGYSFKLTLKTGNRRARSLLRPATNNLTIQIFCELPQTIQFVFAQKEIGKYLYQYERLPKREPEGESEIGTYYIQGGRTEHFRMLVFDKFKRLFFNFSSYEFNIFSTNEQLGVINRLNYYYMNELRLTNRVGMFNVEGRLTGLYDRRHNQIFNL